MGTSIDQALVLSDFIISWKDAEKRKEMNSTIDQNPHSLVFFLSKTITLRSAFAFFIKIGADHSIGDPIESRRCLFCSQ